MPNGRRAGSPSMNGACEQAVHIDQYDRWPGDLTQLSCRDVREVFPRPALLRLEGEHEGAAPLFVSTLLHGNETTSFSVLQHLQRRYGDRPPRSLLIFVGNVDAAALGERRLEDQPDFNRIWAHGASEHHSMAAYVLGEARRAGVFASIDIHNNTGDNPVYGCVNALRAPDLHLASLFGPIAVFYRNPPTTQSYAFSQICPAITVECGRSGDPEGLAAAIDLVETVMRLDSFPAAPPEPGALTLYETVGRVLVDPDCSIAFGREGADLMLRADLEHQNFKPMRAGESWGITAKAALPFQVLDEHDGELTDEFFQLGAQGAVLLKTDVTPAMISPDIKIIRQDCLGYVMRPIDHAPAPDAIAHRQART